MMSGARVFVSQWQNKKKWFFARNYIDFLFVCFSSVNMFICGSFSSTKHRNSFLYFVQCLVHNVMNRCLLARKIALASRWATCSSTVNSKRHRTNHTINKTTLTKDYICRCNRRGDFASWMLPTHSVNVKVLIDCYKIFQLCGNGKQSVAHVVAVVAYMRGRQGT